MSYSRTRMLQTKRKRIRITRNEIAKARESLGQEQRPRRKESPPSKRPKGFWQDGTYCDGFGWAWGLDENLDSVCLGRTEQVIKGENAFPWESNSHSCHSGVRNPSTPMLGKGAKSIVATFKKDPRFLGFWGFLFLKSWV